jgi:hypothetical protein
MLMSKKTEDASRQPEALATFAAATRTASRTSPNGGLKITEDTGPIKGDLAAQQDAATRVLREGAIGKDQGAQDAIDALPDRTRPNDNT